MKKAQEYKMVSQMDNSKKMNQILLKKETKDNNNSKQILILLD